MSGSAFFPAVVENLLELGGARVTHNLREALGLPARTSTIIAKLPSHHSRRLRCQPNLVGAAPFVPLLRSSAQRIRAPVVEENLHNSPTAAGSSY
jgi:hypothetical protein